MFVQMPSGFTATSKEIRLSESSELCSAQNKMQTSGQNARLLNILEKKDNKSILHSNTTARQVFISTFQLGVHNSVAQPINTQARSCPVHPLKAQFRRFWKKKNKQAKLLSGTFFFFFLTSAVFSCRPLECQLSV